MTSSGTVYIDQPPKKSTKFKKQADPETKRELNKLDKLVSGSNRIIFELKSTFPFQLFPDKLIIDENKITIIRRNLFYKREFPISYDNLSTVKVNRNMLFASMEFEVIRFEEPPANLNYLPPQKAAKAKRYISGILQAKKEGVDLSKLDLTQTRNKLEQIGSSKEEITKLW